MGKQKENDYLLGNISLQTLYEHQKICLHCHTHDTPDWVNRIIRKEEVLFVLLFWLGRHSSAFVQTDSDLGRAASTQMPQASVTCAGMVDPVVPLWECLWSASSEQ